MRLLLRALARNESTVVSNRTLKRDIFEDAGESIDVDTVADYLNVLDRLYIFLGMVYRE
jgi:predicted AAA+ superfamily ATPase